jgi:hypothetical protein
VIPDFKIYLELSIFSFAIPDTIPKYPPYNKNTLTPCSGNIGD